MNSASSSRPLSAQDPIEGPLKDFDVFNKTPFADPRVQAQALLAIERSFLQVPLASNFPDRSKQYVSALNKIRTRLLDLEKRYAGITGLKDIIVPNPHNYFQLVQYKHKTNLGMIWLAVNRVTNEPVICKLSRFEDMPRFTDQPQEETKILGELRGHPNIVRVMMDFKHPCDPQFYWCVLEFCEQGDLFTYVENAAADVNMCKNLFKQMIAGIAFMHSKGFAHMDIKPDNFLLTKTSQGTLVCKACDPGMSCRFVIPNRTSAAIPLWLAGFGPEVLSKIVDVFAASWHAHAAEDGVRHERVEQDLIAAFPSMAPRKHELMAWLLALRGNAEQKEGEDQVPKFRGFRGTNKYMAPEVFSSSNRDTGPFYDPRKADVWSLGIVLFMLLFRGNPWNLPDASDERFRFIFTETKGHPIKVAEHLQLILQSWNMVCEPLCIQLLSLMLCDAQYRLLLDEVIRHPWLKEDPPSSPLAIEERLQKQGRQNDNTKEGK